MSISRTLALCLVIIASPVLGQEPDTDKRVEDALLALPEHMRNEATVAYFEAGKRVVLKEGSNGMTCQPDDPDAPGFAVWCYPRSHDAYAQRWYELAAEGNEPSAVDSMIAAEIKEKTLEWPAAAVNYNLRGPSLDTAVPLTVIFMPFATGETLGITEERQFNRPWLMRAGTAYAHVMIPGQ